MTMTEVHVNGRPVPGRQRFEHDAIALRPQLLRFAFILARNRSDAEDLVQDAYIKALKYWESFEPGTNLKAWLFLILRNSFYTEKRRSWRSLPLDMEVAERTIVDPSVNQEDQLEFNQEFTALAPLLGLLPLDIRDSVVGAHYCGIKYEELATVLGVAVGTIKSRVFRGTDALRTILASEHKYSPDVTPWAHAAQSVPRGHPYYPIAKAYEEIYAFLILNGNHNFVQIEFTKPSEVEAIWRQFLASGESQFEDDEDLDSLMRSDYEP
jgi:RNA polymerase sigma-70 factor (ECF subfamily)